MRYLGIDYGARNVGVAVSDDEGRVAFPRDTFENPSSSSGQAMLVEKIGEICTAEKVEGIVVGESRNFRGEENPIMKDITDFKGVLEKALGFPVFLEQEFLTSVEAGRREEGEKKGGAGVHARAAALILQRHLDRKSHPSGYDRGH